MKELAKLEKMGEQHPAAAGTRAYVELLAELPWRCTAADLAAAAASASEATEAETAGGGVVTRPPALPLTPRSLEGVREMLDKGHQVIGKGFFLPNDFPFLVLEKKIIFYSIQ